MMSDDTYQPTAVPNLPAARQLQRAGLWAAALDLLHEPHGTGDGAAVRALRAEILVDRHIWRLDPPGEALVAVDAVEASDPALAGMLRAQVAYWRHMFLRNTGATPDAHGTDPREI